ncbi:MAG: XdhC/CoxI family protein [Rhodovulum sulfidophilum]|uniref:XdhC/CoxI family protein n=1 Tax=Rhodovulum sulfidophilum TaxID=35806 RepID=A0A2W5QG51_RHOSU|nr:MAG: XdhC/CoxI family protein [Rhodovulum sulfidophilum]
MTAEAAPDEAPEAALAFVEAGLGAALATVTETWGSAPRPAGSQLAVGGDGALVGSVSGGCVEGAVVAEAREAIADGAPRLLEYGVADEDAFAVGLACGGTIRILLEPIGGLGPDPELLAAIVEARAARRPVVYAVRPGDWSRRLISDPSDPLWPEAAEVLRLDRSGFVGAWFLQALNPAPRLVIVGAAHVAQHLAPMARIAGFDVTVVDPRGAFATEARFPGSRLMVELPDEALAEIGLDSRVAVVTLTHDPKIDDPAIEAVLASDAFYLGCLGSRKTHGQRLERLAAHGDALARIHAPVGLAIGARTPAEIAVSILAEIVARLRLPG